MKRPLYREPCLLFVTTDFSNKTRADQHLRANVDHCLDPSRIALGAERQNTHIENRVIIHRESVHSRVEIELVRLQTRQVVGQIMAKLDRIRVLRLAFRCYDVCFERKAVLNDDREGLGAILVRERGERVEEGVFAVGEETNGGFVDDAVEGTKNGEDCSGWNGEAEPHSEIGEEGDVETEACGGLIGLDLVQYERNDFIGKVPIVESTDQKKRSNSNSPLRISLEMDGNIFERVAASLSMHSWLRYSYSCWKHVSNRTVNCGSCSTSAIIMRSILYNAFAKVSTVLDVCTVGTASRF